MNSGNNDTRRRRTVPKNDERACLGRENRKVQAKGTQSKPTSKDVRGAGAKQPSKARQGDHEQVQLERRQACQAYGREEAAVCLSRKHGASRSLSILASVTAWQRRCSPRLSNRRKRRSSARRWMGS